MKILQGDCLEKLKELDDNSVDSIVTDPPYHLASIVKRFGKEGSAPAKFGTDGAFKRASTGFMGKTWDGGDIAFNPEMWKECLRVLKPGGHLLSFGGTRTYHRMAVAIEDAGFEIRDMIEWVYSTGFPKSLNVFKALKKKCECGNMEVYEKRVQLQRSVGETEAEYFLRFMQDTDLSQTKSPKEKQGEVLQSGLSEQSTHGTVQGEEPKESGLRGEERILEGRNNLQKTKGKLQGSDIPEVSEEIPTDGEERWIHNATQTSDGSTPEQTTGENGSSTSRRPQSEQQQYRKPCAFCKQWGTQAIRTLGLGTATKPAHEPICMAMKPREGTFAENCLKWGVGGINIDGCRVEYQSEKDKKEGQSSRPSKTSNANDYTLNHGGLEGFDRSDRSELQGRFPANLCHDNSEEVRECFPETGSPRKTRTAVKGGCKGALGNFGGSSPDAVGTWPEDNGGNASRFFKSIIYQAKASKRERNKGCEGLELREIYPQNNSLERKELNATANKRVQNNHPTVKPIALMEYLIKMITPKGGTVLDPFMGSGSTGVAAIQNDFDFIGIDMTPEYIEIAKARINHALKEKNNKLF